MIKDYAIIDHVGSLTSSENKKIYKEVYTQAKAEDLTAYTLRKVCIADSPYCREVTSKMKYRARYVKNPTKVYIVCDTLDATVESITQIWESRNIPVEIFEANAFVRTHKIDIDGQYDRKRRIAETWAPAIGWSFSAPVTRIQTLNNIENFSKRPDHDALVASGETHFSKPFTNADTFLEMNRCIATDQEVDEFYTHLRYLWDTVVDGHRLVEDMLEPDYILCPACGRPMRIHTGSHECPHCDAQFEEEIAFTAYYEDSFEDSEE